MKNLKYDHSWDFLLNCQSYKKGIFRARHKITFTFLLALSHINLVKNTRFSYCYSCVSCLVTAQNNVVNFVNCIYLQALRYSNLAVGNGKTINVKLRQT